VERVIEAARTSGADALHPGYGFLAESLELAEACVANGIEFVGPPAPAVRVMGDKIRARRLVSAAGVPVVPGADRPGMSDDEIVVAVEALGFPVLLKASAGGGGKGMRAIDTAEQLPDAIAGARREAAAAFGDDTLFVERLVHRPRHVEIQVLADRHGHIVHFGDRECSLQRRHQKIVEEAPAPRLDDATRAAMGAHAVASARACGYSNAGTVEFVTSRDDPADFFFIEMNTRLQVEHAVTELVAGVDLVEWQLRIAAGEHIPWAQEEIELAGHAVEARVYAEDPGRGFLPTGGRVLALREPQAPGVRVDSGLRVGDRVTGDYDPMLAKVIAHGTDRGTALRRLDHALGDMVVLGVTTNVPFLRTLVTHPSVTAGDVDTGLAEDIAARSSSSSPPPSVLAAAALLLLGRGELADACDPWDARDGWRLGGRAWTTLQFGTHQVRARAVAPGWLVTVDDDEPVPATMELADDRILLGFGGRTITVDHHREGSTLWLAVDGETHELVVGDPHHRWPSETEGGVLGAIVSPMPGLVVAVMVGAGDVLAAGAPLVTVEAMKMEHTLTAPADAAVAAVHVQVDQQVALGEPLVTLVAPDDAGRSERETPEPA
jgi:acetyl-CoA/propionyl-CoA carboxylase biotin carboxyl carrier protein